MRRLSRDGRRAGRRVGLWLLCCLAMGTAACTQAMAGQPRVGPLEPNAFFEDYQSARPMVDNTVPYEATVAPEWLTTGRSATGTADGDLVATLPVTLTEALLQRGQEQFNIYCSPCHGLAGNGDGIVVQRGFPPPPSFHTDRLRQVPDGYLFQVITNGVGDMLSYAAPVEPADRWAIIAYIRTLQLSQHAPVEWLEPAERQMVGEGDE